METLKTPRVNQPPTEKLLHNNRVFAYNLNTARSKARDPKATFFERKLQQYNQIEKQGAGQSTTADKKGNYQRN